MLYVDYPDESMMDYAIETNPFFLLKLDQQKYQEKLLLLDDKKVKFA